MFCRFEFCLSYYINKLAGVSTLAFLLPLKNKFGKVVNGGIFDTMKENVKVSTVTLNKVRKRVKKTKQTVGGFYDLAAEEKLYRDAKPESPLDRPANYSLQEIFSALKFGRPAANQHYLEKCIQELNELN